LCYIPLKKEEASMNFIGADLREADFTGQDLRDALFDNADLRGAKFDYADVRGVDFQTARVDGASFDHARLYSADFGPEGPEARGALLSVDEEEAGVRQYGSTEEPSVWDLVETLRGIAESDRDSFVRRMNPQAKRRLARHLGVSDKARGLHQRIRTQYNNTPWLED
jgi:hypothetical protein